MTAPQNNDVFLEIARLGARNELLVEYDEKTQFPRLRRLYRSYTRVISRMPPCSSRADTFAQAGRRTAQGSSLHP